MLSHQTALAQELKQKISDENLTENATQCSINQQIFPLIPGRFLSELSKPSLKQTLEYSRDVARDSSWVIGGKSDCAHVPFHAAYTVVKVGLPCFSIPIFHACARLARTCARNLLPSSSKAAATCQSIRCSSGWSEFHWLRSRVKLGRSRQVPQQSMHALRTV